MNGGLRRIFPALAVMLAVCSALAYFYVLPAETASFAQSLLASLLSFSNVYFWQTTGYFDAPTLMKPLVHTWSLSVEEQFYVVFPLFFVAVYRYGRRYLYKSVIAVWLISFAWSALSVVHHPSATFYLPQTRAWELATGTLLALRRTTIPGHRLRTLTSLSGLLMILLTGHFYTEALPFPGPTALLPCLGAALIIMAGEGGYKSMAGEVLSLRPVVFIGTISYSLYLWHWPILVFKRFGFLSWPGPPHGVVQLIVAVEMLVAGTMSWRYIEVPVREGRLRPTKKQLFFGTAVFTSLLLAVGVLAIHTQGFKGRYSDAENEVGSYLKYGGDSTTFRQGHCFLTLQYGFQHFDKQECLTRDPAKSNYLLLGDSHAAQLYVGFAVVMNTSHIEQATAASCLPLLVQPKNTPSYCVDLSRFIFQDYLPTSPRDPIIVAGFWHQNDLPSLGETIQALSRTGHPVYLIGPSMEYDLPLPQLLVYSLKNHDPNLPHRHLNADVWNLEKEMRELSGKYEGVNYVSLLDLFCVNGFCREFAQGNVPMQADANHLTKQGSVVVAKMIVDRDLIGDRPSEHKGL